MNENLKAFLLESSKDEVLKAKIKKAADSIDAEPGTQEFQEMLAERVVPLAKEAGFEINKEDFFKVQCELNDEQLTGISGGLYIQDCLCALAGGGGGTDLDGDTFGCACVGYGQGGDAKDDNMLCVCVVGGVGDKGM